MPLPRVADRSEFTPDYSLPLDIVFLSICLYGETCFCHVQLVLVTAHFIGVILLNSEGINCLML